MSAFRTAAHEACARLGFPRFNPPHRLGGGHWGYIPDSDAKRRLQKDSRLRFGAAPATPGQGSLVAFRPKDDGGQERRPDQGRAGACTFVGTPLALYVSAGAAGTPLAFLPSTRIGYELVRILERPSAAVPLTDSGAMPSDLPTVLRLYGIAPMGGPTPDGRDCDVWTDADTGGVPPGNVNDESTELSDLEASGMKLVTGQYRVDETGPLATKQIEASITGANGKTPAAAGAGLFVDVANFMRWDPAKGPISRIDLSDPQGGGHFIESDYYYTLDGDIMTPSGLLVPKGTVIHGGVNSWGRDWPQWSAHPSYSPYWSPGCWEIAAPCLVASMSDALLFPVQMLSEVA